MGWNLWLDDLRDPEAWLILEEMGYPFSSYLQKGFSAKDFRWAKTAYEAIEMVNEYGVPSFMALDHDLGSHDVFVFLHWLWQEHMLFPPEWQAHSANPCGVENINAFMRSWHKSREL